MTEKNTFEFKGADGNTYTLPSASVGARNLPGRALRDSAMLGEYGMTRYLFQLIEAANPSDEALNALYDLSQFDMLEILREWSNLDGDEDATLGK